MKSSKKIILQSLVITSVVCGQFFWINNVKAEDLKESSNAIVKDKDVLVKDNLSDKLSKGWILEKDKWYYINSDGSKHLGWLNLNGTYYYLDPSTGEMQTGMKEINGYKYYLDDSGAMRTGWVKDNGEYYFFGQDGAMRTGWINDGWADYYLKKDGTIYKGFLDDGLNKYFMDENGQMRKGWVNYKGEYYFFGQDGAMRTGWINDGYAHYFLNKEGKVTKGWLDEGNNRYYLGDDGAMRTGWQEIKDNWYYFENSGNMIKNKVIDDWYLDKNGVGNPIVTEGVYGKSGKGRDLEYYRVGHGKKVLFAVFGVHGYEDAWDGDSKELKIIAENSVEKLKNEYDKKGIDLSEWSVYILPSANPDGRLDGWTNYGPGRTTVTTRNDINRSFPIGFKPYYSERNYTGKSPLGSPEARALYDFINKTMAGATEKVLLDVHGWENKTIGDPSIAKYFDREFGFSNINKYPGGFVITYGKSIGAKSVLVEFPFPNSHNDIVRRDFSGKFSKGLMNILLNN